MLRELKHLLLNISAFLIGRAWPSLLPIEEAPICSVVAPERPRDHVKVREILYVRVWRLIVIVGCPITSDKSLQINSVLAFLQLLFQVVLEDPP